QELEQFPASRRALLDALGVDSPITVIATARYPEKLKAEEVAAFMHIIHAHYSSHVSFDKRSPGALASCRARKRRDDIHVGRADGMMDPERGIRIRKGSIS